MKIDTFGVEMWMNELETKCAFNLAETCVEGVVRINSLAKNLRCI